MKKKLILSGIAGISILSYVIYKYVDYVFSDDLDICSLLCEDEVHE